MKIIDKNKDYYDFYQNIYRDDSITFDRKDSYDLSKEEFASHFNKKDYRFHNHFNRLRHIYILLEVGYCNWLFEFTITATKPNDILEQCTDYTLTLSYKWKDYNKDILVPIKLSQVAFEYYIKDLVIGINNKDYAYKYVFDKFIMWRGDEKIIKTIPLLKNIGIATFIPPLDIYLALEEYYMQEKTRAERIDPIGQTNDDKIIVHGFDTKTSFRGKKQ